MIEDMGTSKEFRFSIERTTEDYRNYVRHVQSHGYKKQTPVYGLIGLVAIFPIILIPVVSALLLYDLSFEDFYINPMIFVACVAAFLLVGIQILATLHAAKNLGKTALHEKGYFLRPFQLLVNADGVEQRSHGALFFVNWSSLIGVLENKKGVILLLDHMDGLYIPERIFISEEQRSNFVSFVQKHISKG